LNLEGGYSIGPDLIVRSHERAFLEAVVRDLVAEGELLDAWLVPPAVATPKQIMMHPFQAEIRDRDGRVILIGKISEISETSFLGEVIRDDMPQHVRDVLQRYHVAAECQAFRECGDLLTELLAFELQVTGIPGKAEPVPLEDFQLGPDGLFSLQVEGVLDLQDKIA
jgi:hypothetical protein